MLKNEKRKIDAEKKGVRYVYMIRVESRTGKSRFYNQKNILYTGQTNNIIAKMKQHASGVNSKFLTNYFPESRKTLVFVDYVFGNEYDAMSYETKIKNKTSDQKRKLINSDANKLVKYIPLKAIILKKYKKDDEQIALKFGGDSNECKTSC